MTDPNPRPEQWWESADDAWVDEGPDVPHETLSAAMADPISRFALSVPRIPRQRTGEPPEPLRVPTLPPEAVEPTFTQLIPKQYRPRELDLRDCILGKAELVVTTTPDPRPEVTEDPASDDDAATPVVEDVTAAAPTAADDTDDSHDTESTDDDATPAPVSPLRMLRRPAKVALRAARALKHRKAA